MTKSPLMLSLVALLAACGGGGGSETQMVDDAPEAPEPDMQTPVADDTPAPPPDPVTFTLAGNDPSSVSRSGDVVTLQGVEYNVESGMLSVLGSFFEDELETVRVISIEDDEATVLLAATQANIRNLEFGDDETETTIGTRFSVDDIGSIVAGEATFTGDYSAILALDGTEADDFSSATNGTIGDIELNVNFAEYLSQSSVSGVISNRQIIALNDGDPNPSFAFADVIIENGQFDDNGQFVADITGGEIVLTRDDIPESRFITTIVSGTLVGQIGGETAGVAAGLVRIEHRFIDSLNNPELEAPSFRSEIGGFIATPD